MWNCCIVFFFHHFKYYGQNIYKKWKIKNIVLDVRSAAHLEAFWIKQGVFFYCTSLMLWACAETCACDRTPDMPKPAIHLLIYNKVYWRNTSLFTWITNICLHPTCVTIWEFYEIKKDSKVTKKGLTAIIPKANFKEHGS